MGKRDGNIGRREFIQASGAAALSAGWLSAHAQQAGDTDRASAAEKPNILFIIPDHQAFYGHDREGEFEYKWPRFEEFCSQGVRFDRAYSVCPLCTPARGSMMTGLYPSAHGLIRNTDYEPVHDFREGQRFYSHYLSEAGYRNAYVGKWHCGKDKVPVDFGIEGWALPDYGQGYQTDAAIGRILTVLDRLGLTDNTLVIWCADHGDAVACHGGLWDKACTYIEEVARVPMAVRWPRRFKGGERTDKLVSNMDATATILEAAGVDVPRDMHSRSLLALCRDPQGAKWRDYLVSEHHGHGGDNVVQRILVGHRYKYVAALYEGDELYDLQNDPFELKNLVDSASHRNVKAEMRGRILGHLERIEDARPQVSEEAILAEEKLAIELRNGR